MTFPTIPTTGNGRIAGLNQLNTTATLTSPNLNTLTKTAGDIVIAIAGEYQSNAGADAAYTGWAGGGLTWNEIRDSTGTADCRLGVAWARLVTGSESGTVTVTRSGTLVGDASIVLMVIPNVHPTAAPEATAVAVATAAAANPASLSPSWGAADTLWIAVCGNGMTATGGTWTGIDGAPTNYGNLFDTNAADTSTIGDFSLGVAFRQNNAASEDAAGFAQDTTNARSAGLTIAVRPGPDTFNETARPCNFTVGVTATDVQAHKELDRTCLFLVTESVGVLWGSNGPATFDAVGPSSAGAGGATPTSPITWSHDCSGTRRLLLVGVSAGGTDVDAQTVTATYDGVSMTSLGTVLSNNNISGKARLFGLLNPAKGSHTVEVSFSGGTPGTSFAMETGSLSFKDVLQTSLAAAVKNIATAFGATANPTVDVSSAVGNLVVDLLVSGGTITSSADVQRWLKNVNTATGGGNGAQSTQNGASTVTMNYNSAAEWWGLLGASVVAGVAVFSPGERLSRPSDTLSDDFADGTLDSAKWTIVTGSNVTETGGKLHLDPPTVNDYQTVDSAFLIDLTSENIFGEFVMPTGGTGSQQSGFELRWDANNWIGFGQYGVNLGFILQEEGVTTDSFFEAYNATNHKWLRFRTDGTTLYLDVSTNGSSWNNWKSMPLPLWPVRGLTVRIFAGWFNAGDSDPGELVVDNFNTAAGPTTYDDTNRPCNFAVTVASTDAQAQKELDRTTTIAATITVADPAHRSDLALPVAATVTQVAADVLHLSELDRTCSFVVTVTAQDAIPVAVVSASGGDSGATTYANGATQSTAYEGGFTPLAGDIALLRISVGGAALSPTVITSGYTDPGGANPVAQATNSRSWLFKKTLTAGEAAPQFSMDGAATAGWDLVVVRFGAIDQVVNAVIGSDDVITLPGISASVMGAQIVHFAHHRVNATNNPSTDGAFSAGITEETDHVTTRATTNQNIRLASGTRHVLADGAYSGDTWTVTPGTVDVGSMIGFSVEVIPSTVNFFDETNRLCAFDVTPTVVDVAHRQDLDLLVTATVAVTAPVDKVTMPELEKLSTATVSQTATDVQAHKELGRTSATTVTVTATDNISGAFNETNRLCSFAVSVAATDVQAMKDLDRSTTAAVTVTAPSSQHFQELDRPCNFTVSVTSAGFQAQREVARLTTMDVSTARTDVQVMKELARTTTADVSTSATDTVYTASQEHRTTTFTVTVTAQAFQHYAELERVCAFTVATTSTQAFHAGELGRETLVLATVSVTSLQHMAEAARTSGLVVSVTATDFYRPLESLAPWHQPAGTITSATPNGSITSATGGAGISDVIPDTGITDRRS